MNNHSPAPWSIRGNTLRDAEEIQIAKIETALCVTVAQDDANRRVIESAPEMLSLLQRLTHPMASDSAVDDARALLAKLSP